MEMTPLYGPEDLRRLENKRRISTALCWLLSLGTLGVCVTLCALTNGGNAGRMELACILVWVIGGWVVLYLRRFVVRETRLELQHAEMLNSGEASTVHGRLTVTKERLRIVGSIRITMAELENEAGKRRLKFCTSREKKLKSAGTELTLYLVNGYIAGWAKPSAAEDPAAQSDPIEA